MDGFYLVLDNSLQKIYQIGPHIFVPQFSQGITGNDNTYRNSPSAKIPLFYSYLLLTSTLTKRAINNWQLVIDNKTQVENFVLLKN